MAKIPQSQLEAIYTLHTECNDASRDAARSGDPSQLNELILKVTILENQVAARLRNGDHVVAGLLKAHFRIGADNVKRLIVELA